MNTIIEIVKAKQEKYRYMLIRQRYEIARAKADELRKLNMPQTKKDESYVRLAQWIEDIDKDTDELPFPFGKKPRKI